jgi:DedD protein
MKEHKDKGKSSLAAAKGALVLIIASVGSVALFFAVARLVDFITFKNCTVQPRRLLPFESPPPAAGTIKQKNAPKTEPPMKLGFYTSLFRTEPNSANPSLIPKKAETKPAPAKPPAESSLLKTPAESAVLKKPAETTAPARKALEPGKALQEQPEAGTQYVLQVGAFQRPEKAAQVVTELKNAGYTAYTDTITVAGKGTLIRVRMGSFHDVSEARRKATEVQGKTKIPIHISKK